MHGQYDWMNDPHINSRTYDWDIMADSDSWKRYHNYEHHTYTNIIGKDPRDTTKLESELDFLKTEKQPESPEAKMERKGASTIETHSTAKSPSRSLAHTKGPQRAIP